MILALCSVEDQRFEGTGVNSARSSGEGGCGVVGGMREGGLEKTVGEREGVVG